MMYSDFFK